jgi:pimeloyl-ACP methyl ester carboxylesterase
VLSFNFRGVMGSGGTGSAGEREVLDVAAAVGRVREAASGPTIACGWSFGANAAFRHAVRDDRIAAVALVGIPLGEWAQRVPELPDTSELRSFDRPVLLVSGQGDTFSPRPDLESLARKLPSAELVIVAGTDHFFWKREKELAELIGDFADGVVSGTRAGGTRRSR